MGTRNLILVGENLVAGTNITILSNGVSVFSGEVGKTVTDGTGDNIAQIDSWSVTVNDQTDAAQVMADLATDCNVSISVVSGAINIASITQDNIVENDRRRNILIDGAAPDWPTSGLLPGGTEENPDWTGWAFGLEAGQTLTCTCTVDAIPLPE